MLNTLNGRVWIDNDRDGIQDSPETGAQGVTVTLIGAGPDGVFGTADDTTETAVTDSSGAYTFMVLDGEYKLAFGEKTGYMYTAQNAGTDDGIDSDADSAGSIGPFTLAHHAVVTYDAGLVLCDTNSASVGDRVWLDANGNGVQDSGEAGAAGVKVTLRSAGADGTVGTTDDAIINTTTDANGNYRFNGLAAGDYRVIVEAQDGYDFTTANAGGNDDADSDVTANGRVNVTLGIGESNQSVDAGLVVKTPVDPRTAVIGDRVWNDANGNGVQDNGEGGLAGVTVTLAGAGADGVLGNGDDTSASATTDANGAYSFGGLAAGQYQVTFGVKDGYMFVAPNAGGNDATDSDADAAGKSHVITLAAGQSDTSVDAGQVLCAPNNASIGDLVWLDANGDGVQSIGEVGMAGVTVQLMGAGADGTFGTGDDAVLATTSTDPDGEYSFGGLAAGNYQVQFVAASGYGFTTRDAGTSDAKDSDADVNTGRSQTITLAASASNTTVDAGLTLLDPKNASIGDRVWADANGNGVQDSGEAGLAGVNVSLYNFGNGTTLNTTTDGGGNYNFANLSAGHYYVLFGGKAGYQFTSTDAGGNDALDSDANAAGYTAAFDLAASQQNLTIDAGMTLTDPKTASIGDKVWSDANGNGLQDAGEAGLANVGVQLLQGGTVLATTTTGADGAYSFGNLAAGQYQVVFGGQAGYAFTTANAGNDAIDSDADSSGRSHVITLGIGQSDTTVDAGMTLLDGKNASIGDRVWLDADRDGVQDSGEAGVSGVTVTLKGAGADGVLGTGDDTSATTTTNSTGAYSFTNLAAGQYQVTFGGKTGHSFTTANVGNDATDSDANSAGKSHVITLAAGQADMSVDAGLIKDICAKIVSSAGATGTVSMNEGTQQSFKIQLDSTVMQDTQFWVQVNDGSAHRTNFNASSQIVHADPRKLSTDYNMTNSGSQQSSAHKAFKMRGPSDMSWDYGVYDTSGNIVGSQSGFWVTVKAGASTSATFSVNAWKEFVDVDKDGSSTYNTKPFSSTEIKNKVWMESSVENFSLELTQSGNPNVVVCDPATTVNIVDKSTYEVTSPIILDLDGNGVQTTALDAAAGSFDLLGNGQAVASGWASSGDGFLAIDVNGNGKIDDIGELFGGRVGEGFAKLSGFDSNGDGVVNAADADFDKLLVWQDANGNRQTDAGELRTLGEAGIASLNTDNWFQNIEQNGNVLGETSTATRTDGSSIEMIDAYFKYEELPSLDSLVEADNALFDSVLGGGSAREMPAIADIAFDSAAEAQRVIAEAMKQADASLAVAV